MFKDTAGAEPQVIFLIRLFNRSSVRTEEDLSLVRQRNRFRIRDTEQVAGRDCLEELTVESVTAFLDIRVIVLVEAVEGFFTVDNRPNQTACFGVHIGCEVSQVMAVAQCELTIFVEQGLFREPVQVARSGCAVDLTDEVRIRPSHLQVIRTCKENVIERHAGFDAHLLGFVENARQFTVGVAVNLEARNRLFAPTVFNLQAFCKFHHHPQIGTSFSGRIGHLLPALCTTFGVAIETPFFEDHCCRQNQVGVLAGECRIGIGNHNEVFGMASCLKPVIGVRCSLEGVDNLCPNEVDRIVFHTAEDFHVSTANLRVNRLFRDTPNLFTLHTSRFLSNQQVGRQTVAESTDFTSRTASGRLTG